MNAMGYVFTILISAFVILLILILFIRINLCVTFSKKLHSKTRFFINLEFFGGRIKKKIDLAKKAKKETEAIEKDIESVKLSFKEKVKKYYHTFKLIKGTWDKSKLSVRKRILLKKTSLSVTFGTGDAAHTGILTGILWAGIYDVIAFISKFIRVTQPEICVNPIYDEESLEIKGECILTLSLANIISIITRLSLNYFLVKRKLRKKEKAAITNGNSD